MSKLRGMILLGQKITYKEFIQRLKEKTDTIIPVSEYIGWGKPMTYRCLVCGNEWEVSEASRFYYGFGCPKCGDKMKSIKQLKTHDQFVNEMMNISPNIKHFGGEEKFRKQQEHDKRKREYASTHNIPLLEIWYDEINHIESILDNYLQIKQAS